MTTIPAADRREHRRHEYNAELAGCPGHEVLAILGEKWVTLVLAALAEGPLRHAALAREVAGASQKMLTQTLRRLERDGLLTRTVTAAVPVQVDYRLTPLGQALLPLQRAILGWGETHVGAIRAARAAYDSTVVR
ncbi:transcriptional regulator [Paractinoplanes abujensis]|uniref:DNA-binding HxlR family transcriptional regulator n=1 Tax=Paractinoplanes abujensis TaxID=882441 RepID=A0A7W7CTP3_9ACTN|nr:helix-turn-helix domain-containing protein [Actinoplanes abujensis]MBB4692796.1 DNA-binding HxlR family transcriptional regulator [Actinoplanes abujensis]GID22705.1 transcriptional regulator [Actinoplanes abujensis]